ncbi:hypothetical protein KK092_07310 [Curtobacterium flaccumfaciens pv. flaccumfaciens]|uniref:hypothetical protein n=1 Tax=Curtobacterium flaccumfaciens TaxID=2035 RepID=UPI001BDED7E5|nr:hypothetical protein [Curtobacterium flaccumfaciens]MBT1669185.1 hypothetical protein [Curtobacterium flaccumfaciens pv. flaccumfaciens]
MNHDEHIREHIAAYEFPMPPGFEDGPAPTMSPVVYWWLSLTLLVTPQQVQDQPLWKQMVRNLNHTADRFDEGRWAILDDWLARAFKDISAALPDTLKKTVRTAARLRTLDAIEAARIAAQKSDEYIAEDRFGDERGDYVSLYWALDGWALFASQYVRPADERQPEVLRSAANAAEELIPLRAKANLTYGVMDLLGSLSHPTSNPKRGDGKRSARSPRFPGHNYPY